MEGKVSEKLALEKHGPWSGVVTGKHGGKGLRKVGPREAWSLVMDCYRKTLRGRSQNRSLKRAVVFHEGGLCMGFHSTVQHHTVDNLSLFRDMRATGQAGGLNPVEGFYCLGFLGFCLKFPVFKHLKRKKHAHTHTLKNHPNQPENRNSISARSFKSINQDGQKQEALIMFLPLKLLNVFKV